MLHYASHCSRSAPRTFLQSSTFQSRPCIKALGLNHVSHPSNLEQHRALHTRPRCVHSHGSRRDGEQPKRHLPPDILDPRVVHLRGNAGLIEFRGCRPPGECEFHGSERTPGFSRRKSCATSSPPSAAARISRAASLRSCRAPIPCSRASPYSYCAAGYPASAPT